MYQAFLPAKFNLCARFLLDEHYEYSGGEYSGINLVLILSYNWFKCWRTLQTFELSLAGRDWRFSAPIHPSRQSTMKSTVGVATASAPRSLFPTHCILNFNSCQAINFVCELRPSSTRVIIVSFIVLFERKINKVLWVTDLETAVFHLISYFRTLQLTIRTTKTFIMSV